jgi:hypothetical protein
MNWVKFLLGQQCSLMGLAVFCSSSPEIENPEFLRSGARRLAFIKRKLRVLERNETRL